MESHMIIRICNKESLQAESAWKEHAGKGNIRQKGAIVAGGVSQTGANTPTRGVHDRHKGDSRTVRTALAQGLSRRTPEAAAAVVRAPHRLVPRLPPLLLALRFVLPPAS